MLTLEHKREREIERRNREARKWACSDLWKFFTSTPETAELNKSINFTGGMNFDSSDFSGK